MGPARQKRGSEKGAGRAPGRILAPVFRGALAVGLSAAVGCVESPRSRGGAVVARADSAPVFDYPTIDGQRLSSASTRGRRTVLVFLTTYDLGSQVVVRELAEVVRVESPRINAGLVALEPPRHLPLVEAFAAALEITIPVALADAATLGGRGPFGPVDVVPTVLVLDARGGVVWQKEGAVSAAELRSALRRAAD